MNNTTLLFISLPAIVGNILLAVVLIPFSIYIGYKFGLSGYLEKKKQQRKDAWLKLAFDDGYNGREKRSNNKDYIHTYEHAKWCREDDMLW